MSSPTPNYQIYAVKYAHVGRRSSDNFIGGDFTIKQSAVQTENGTYFFARQRCLACRAGKTNFFHPPRNAAVSNIRKRRGFL